MYYVVLIVLHQRVLILKIYGYLGPLKKDDEWLSFAYVVTITFKTLLDKNM